MGDGGVGRAGEGSAMGDRGEGSAKGGVGRPGEVRPGEGSAMGDVGRPRPWLLTEPVTVPTGPLSSGRAASECSTDGKSVMGLAKGGGGVERAMGSAGVGGGVAGSGEGPLRAVFFFFFVVVVGAP